MSKQILIQDKMVSHKNVTISSTEDGAKVHIVIDGNPVQEMQLTAEQYMILHNITTHLIDWE